MVWKFNQTFLAFCYVWNERRRRDMLQDTDGELCCLLAPLLTMVSCCASVKIIRWKWRLSLPECSEVWRVWQSPKPNLIETEWKTRLYFPLHPVRFPSPFFSKWKREIIYYFKSYRMMIITVARIQILFLIFVVMQCISMAPTRTYYVPCLLNTPEYKIDFITIIITVIIHFIVILSEVYKWRH